MDFKITWLVNTSCEYSIQFAIDSPPCWFGNPALQADFYWTDDDGEHYQRAWSQDLYTRPITGPGTIHCRWEFDRSLWPDPPCAELYDGEYDLVVPVAPGCGGSGVETAGVYGLSMDTSPMGVVKQVYNAGFNSNALRLRSNAVAGTWSDAALPFTGRCPEIIVLPNGRLWVMREDGGTIKASYSDDDGATWT